MDTIILPIILLTTIVAFLIIVFLIAIYIFHPNQRRQRLLREKARTDYLGARGTAHLRMLDHARGFHKLKIQSASKELDENQAARNKLLNEQLNEQRKLLETQIVREHIHEIPGIGQKFGELIMSRVFHSRLSDLKYASSTLRGIGDGRQKQINIWIRSWESLLPELLNQDFPGKKQAIEIYTDKIQSISVSIKVLEKKIEKLQAYCDKCNEYIRRLEEISVRDFEVALSRETQSDPRILFYLTGVFPEWEPMPDWFKEIVSEN
jgi:hypothetical protein